ncbi:MAG: hypothetical protein H6708_09565 [Kofleriaceae bacterium]|nr:hypothetical protein [Myxococcales bacterium]MCB9560642.1 hypothetical protein [Kofleriaceae bacterium]
MRALIVSVIVAVGLLAAPSVQAKSHTFPEGKVTVDLPDSWLIQADKGTVTFTTKDQTLAINLAWAGPDLDQAWDILVDQVGKVVKQTKVGDKKPGVMGDLKGFVTSGTGTLNGVDVDILLSVVQTPAGAMTVFAIGQKGKYEKHEKDMQRVLFGIKAIGGAGGGVFGDDEGYGGLGADARKFADKVAKAITKKDAKAFVKLVAKAGFQQAAGDMAVTTKTSKLASAIKKAKGLLAYLNVPEAGDFHVNVRDDGAQFAVWRGTGDGVVAYIDCEQVKGKWYVTGMYMEDHGVE